MSFEGIKTATAFWSYAHSDDEGSGGQIRRLKVQLDHAFKLHRGEQLASFFDRTGDHKIEWGEEWRSKIRTSISGTTFFIPVISPSYLKSPMCRQEFDEFVKKAAESDLNELILPILWVPIDPESEDEQRIYDAAGERQWVDWSKHRKLDESSSEYKGLVDEMGERLAKVARSVARRPEVAVVLDGDDASNSPDDPRESTPAESPEPTASDGDVAVWNSNSPGLYDVGTDAVARAESFAAHLTSGFQALNALVDNVLKPNPLNAQATPGQRNFYFKRIANEMKPYVQQFETSIAAAEEDALHLNDLMYELVDLLQDPEMRAAIDLQNVGRLKQLPAQLAVSFGDYDSFRHQLSSLGRMSRDLREPLSAFERAFSAMDEIQTLVRDWTTAMAALEEKPSNPLFRSSVDPDTQMST